MSYKKRRRLNKKSKRGRLIDILPLAALAAILIYAIAYSLIFLGGPSFYGDDTAYLGNAGFVIQGIFHESAYIFSVRLLQFYPIALFYWLFGVSLLTSSLWDIISFIGSIIIAFLIGKHLYGAKAGLIAAFSLAFIPNVAMLAPTVSDDITSMFFVGLVLLFFLYGSRRNSKLYYFLSGAFFVWSILITPEALLIEFAIVLFAIIEILRKNVKVNRQFLFIIYGILFAGALLMLFNYYNAVPSYGGPLKRALITLNVNSNFYSKVGGTNTIPSTNIDPRFYLNTMFGYNLFGNIMRGTLNFNYIINSFSGFFFYALFILLFILPAIKIRRWWAKLLYLAIVGGISFFYLDLLVPIQNSLPCTSSVIGPACPINLFYITFVPIIILAIELILLRKDPIYTPLFIFVVGLVLLTYGPMHISFSPFEYLIVYRLQRFLAVLGIPIAVSLGIAFSELIDISKKKMIRVPMAVVVVAVLIFLAYTSFRIDAFAYNVLAYQRYDQLAIAKYLMHYPDYVKIYFASGFSNIPIYMKFENMSRFIAYDSIQNCREIPNGSFVVIPKYVRVFGLNYTPNPETYCPYWKLIYYPKYPYYTNSTIRDLSTYFGAKLYYVPGGNLSILNATQVLNSTQTQTTVQTTSTISYSNFNYFNLTGVGYINPATNQLENFTIVNKVENVTISLNKSSAYPGEYVAVNVLFIGEFKWYANPATSYYLNQTIHIPLINFHYYGVELANQTGKLLVQSNGPWYNYITQIGEPHQLIYGNSSRYLLVHWVVTPNSSMAGKAIKFCGGYFATYNNTKLMGGFGDLFDYLAYNQTDVINQSVINIVSNNCAVLNVT